MSFLKTLGTLLGSFGDRLSHVVNTTQDPAMKIESVVRHVVEQTPEIKVNLSGAVARFHQLEAEELAIEGEIKTIETQMSSAAQRQNDRIGEMLSKKRLEKQAKLEGIKKELVTASKMAEQAKGKFAEWQTELAKVQTEASASLDANQAAIAQEKLNYAKDLIGSVNSSSEVQAAYSQIAMRKARAEAIDELGKDPVEEELANFEKEVAASDAKSEWAKFKAQAQPQPQTPVTAGAAS